MSSPPQEPPVIPPFREAVLGGGHSFSRVWWRFLHAVSVMTSTNTNTTSIGASNVAALEAQVADLLERLAALENAQQPPGDLAARVAALEAMPASVPLVDLSQRIDDLAALLPPLTVLPDQLTYTNQTSDAAAALGTLTNAPNAGNPVFWLRGTINGVAVASPWWTV